MSKCNKPVDIQKTTPPEIVDRRGQRPNRPNKIRPGARGYEQNLAYQRPEFVEKLLWDNRISGKIRRASIGWMCFAFSIWSNMRPSGALEMRTPQCVKGRSSQVTRS